MAIAIFILFALPFLQKLVITSSKFDVLSQFFFWLFVSDVLLLGWLGAQLVEYPYVIISQIATVIYFSYFFLIIPLLSIFESKIILESNFYTIENLKRQ
jgi:ubiquinol-cytochrome c reductase cytochrome b subunit